MSYIYPERSDLMAALAEATGRFEMLLRSLEPEDAAKPILKMDWTVGDTAAHVLTVVRRVFIDMRRSTSPADTSRLNQQCLSELPERNPQRLADLLAVDASIMLVKVFPRISDDKPIPFHAATTTTILPVMGVILGEFLLHGEEIARATSRPWTIPSHSAALVWRSILGVASAWLKPDAVKGLEETYVFHLAGENVAAVLHFKDGQLMLDSQPDTPANYRLEVNPLDLLLAFPYNRKPASDPVIAHLAARFEPI